MEFIEKLNELLDENGFIFTNDRKTEGIVRSTIFVILVLITLNIARFKIYLSVKSLGKFYLLFDPYTSLSVAFLWSKYVSDN